MILYIAMYDIDLIDVKLIIFEEVRGREVAPTGQVEQNGGKISNIYIKI